MEVNTLFFAEHKDYRIYVKDKSFVEIELYINTNNNITTVINNLKNHKTTFR
jgi:hypothetical protein